MYLYPGLISDESLYSLVASQCLTTTEYWPQTNTHVFGKTYVRLHPVLPAYIHRVGAHLGVDPLRLLLNHTGYVLAAMPLPSAARLTLMQAMLGDNGIGVMAHARQTHSKLQLPCEHRYCPRCVQADRTRLGSPYWHIVHQLDGVSVCPAHQIDLVGVPASRNKRYLLPPVNTAAPYNPPDTRAIQFSTYIAQLHRYLTHTSPAQALHDYYQIHLGNQGFLSASGQLKLTRLKAALAEHWQGLFHSPVSSLPVSLASFTFLTQMVHTRHPFHYLKHALLMAFLTQSPAQFFTDHPQHNTPPLMTGQSRKADDQLEQTLHLLRNGHSLRHVAQQVGRSLGYVQQLAERKGIETERRFQKISRGIRRAVWRKAFMGEHRRKLATAFHISVAAVEQIIQSHGGLSAWRRHLAFQRRRRAHRAALQHTLQAHPDATRTELKTLTPAAYLWLFKHDKHWLNQQLPPRQPSTFHPQETWAERDERFAAQIQNQLTQARSLTDIDRQCGGRGWLPRMRAKLPKALAAAQRLLKGSAIPPQP